MNKKDFSDPLTVIYGENKEDGSLFGSLFQYRDKLFMEEHPVIYIYKPDQILIYRIFAAYRNDNRHLLKRFNQGIYEGNIRAFIKDILSQRAMDATIEQDAPIDTNDYFLTLSTHDPAGEEYRHQREESGQQEDDRIHGHHAHHTVQLGDDHRGQLSTHQPASRQPQGDPRQ